MISNIDKLMMELGYVSLHFSTFDFLLNEVNSSLINMENEKIGYYISTKLNTHARIDLYKNLLKLIPFPKELVMNAEYIVNDFSKAKGKRNELIHSFWHTKFEDELPLDGIYLSKFNSNWDNAEKIEITDLTELKENLIELIQKQSRINLEILTINRKIIEEDNRIKNKLKHMFENP